MDTATATGSTLARLARTATIPVAAGLRVTQVAAGLAGRGAGALLARMPAPDGDAEARAEDSAPIGASQFDISDERDATLGPASDTVPSPGDVAESYPEPSPAAEQAGAPGAAAPEVAMAERQLEAEAAAEAASTYGDGGPTPADFAVDGESLTTADLAVPDFDHVTVGSLRGRLRSLELADLVTLRAYERSHADRLQVVTMLENRIAKLERELGDAGRPAASPATTIKGA